MKNSKIFWIVVGVITMILVDIFIVPNLSYYFSLKFGDPALKTAWDVIIILIKDILGVMALIFQFIISIFLIRFGVIKFNEWIDKLKFEKKKRLKEVQFQTIDEFKDEFKTKY